MDEQGVKALVARFDRVKGKFDAYGTMLSDAYRYSFPEHRFGFSKGQQRDLEILNDTALRAVEKRAAKLHGELFPAYQEWMDFDPAAADFDGNGWKPYYQKLKQNFHLALESSNFHIEIEPALRDACVSAGIILLHSGTPECPFVFEAVPPSEIFYEEDFEGLCRNVFRTIKLRASEIKTRWPDAVVPAELAEAAKKEDAEVECLEAVRFDVKNRTYDYTVLADKKDALIDRKGDETSPFCVFRWSKLPGEAIGYGPVLSCLASTKVVNKVEELVLKNGAIAVAGMWQYESNGVINTDNIRLEPGAVVPKEPGTSGLEPLRAAGDFNVSQIIIKDLETAIKEEIEGPALPPTDHGSRRSAYEIGARGAEAQAVNVPTALRILTETRPLWERAIGILMHPSMAASRYYVKPFEIAGTGEVKIVPRSPMIRLREEAVAKAAAQAYVTCLQIEPEVAKALVKRVGWIRDTLDKSGFPPEFLLTDEEAEKALAGQQAQQMMQQAAADPMTAAQLGAVMDGGAP